VARNSDFQRVNQADFIPQLQVSRQIISRAFPQEWGIEPEYSDWK
jgi:hypothetical protein